MYNNPQIAKIYKIFGSGIKYDSFLLCCFFTKYPVIIIPIIDNPVKIKYNKYGR
ncbi:unnamed protein product [marine sediment metagenome]|uniref:Uncharacterized protein n=1 Tax=marine sediment metagenome TaxID=412755 RepID=X1G6Q7_9ZZZZ